jgi:hypothetical protein
MSHISCLISNNRWDLAEWLKHLIANDEDEAVSNSVDKKNHCHWHYCKIVHFDQWISSRIFKKIEVALLGFSKVGGFRWFMKKPVVKISWHSFPLTNTTCFLPFFASCSGIEKGPHTESIKWFIKDRVFSLSYDLAPPPNPAPSPVSKLCLSFSVFLCVAGRDYWWGRGGGGGAITYEGETAWSSTNHSIHSALTDVWIISRSMLLIIICP